MTAVEKVDRERCEASDRATTIATSVEDVLLLVGRRVDIDTCDDAEHDWTVTVVRRLAAALVAAQALGRYLDSSDAERLAFEEGIDAAVSGTPIDHHGFFDDLQRLADRPECEHGLNGPCRVCGPPPHQRVDPTPGDDGADGGFPFPSAVALQRDALMRVARIATKAAADTAGAS